MPPRSAGIALRATNSSCTQLKTGTPVYCPLLPFVIEALHAIAEKTAYFFILTGIPDGHAHRFRDVLGRTSSWRCSDRTSLNSFRSPKREDHGEALRTLGESASGTVGGRCSTYFGRPLNQNEGDTEKRARVMTKEWCRRGESEF